MNLWENLSKNWRNVADFPTNIYIYLQLAQKLTDVIHYMNYYVHFTSTLKPFSTK